MVIRYGQLLTIPEADSFFDSSKVVATLNKHWLLSATNRGSKSSEPHKAADGFKNIKSFRLVICNDRNVIKKLMLRVTVEVKMRSLGPRTLLNNCMSAEQKSQPNPHMTHMTCRKIYLTQVWWRNAACAIIIYLEAIRAIRGALYQQPNHKYQCLRYSKSNLNYCCEQIKKLKATR